MDPIGTPKQPHGAITAPLNHGLGLLWWATDQAGRQGYVSMNDDEPTTDSDSAIKAQINVFRQEHQDLDASIVALETMPQPDLLLITRLKRKKLGLRDLISRLEDRLTPDIIA